jgi:hypothetical protein
MRFAADQGGAVVRFVEVRDSDQLVADLVPRVVRARNALIGPSAADADTSLFAGPQGEAWVDVRIATRGPTLRRYRRTRSERQP